MAIQWAMVFDGTNDYCIPDNHIVIPSNTSFEIELIVTVPSDFSRVFGNTSGYTSRLLIFNSTNEVRLTDSAGNDASFIAPTYTKENLNVFKFVRDFSGNIDFYLNNVFVSTVTGFFGSFNINRVGRQFGSFTKGALASLVIDVDGSRLHNWNANLSDHGEVAPTIADSVSGNTLTGTNMFEDGRSWVNFVSNDISRTAQLSISSFSQTSIKSRKKSNISLLLVNNSILELFSKKLSRVQISLLNSSAISILISKYSFAYLSIKNGALSSADVVKKAFSKFSLSNTASAVVDSNKLSKIKRFVSLSLHNATNFLIKSKKRSHAKLHLTGACLSFTSVEKHALCCVFLNSGSVTQVKSLKLSCKSLLLTNTAVISVTQFSESYVPVIRTISIEGNIVSLHLPSNINNTLTIKGLF